MIRDDEHSRLGWQALYDMSGRRVEALVNIAHSIAKTWLGIVIIQEMVRVHVLPEEMLDNVNAHEHKHHQVLRVVFEKVESSICPLNIEFLELG